MPKDKCIVCGKPATGRYCYDHLGEALDRSRELYQKDKAAWKKQVDEANKPPAQTKNS
jgi:predicted nucleic acid-binding Zn ribbon protein